jgi:cell wall-associated NlpC family hydrolase
VLDAGSTPLATFTVGARTVAVRGPARVFSEPATTTAKIASTTWVRLLPRPFNGTVDAGWLERALATTSPDVLARAAQYVTGAPTRLAGDGSVLADDADYGPLQSETDQAGALDCSGFVRMIFGHRFNVPLTLSPDGTSLPRRSAQMLSSAPGVVTIRNTGVRPLSLAKLAPGDLVFFDGSTDDGTLVDHVGIFLGRDDGGAPRFVSSRKTANGPTLGDVGGRSTLSGTGHYANAWRAARRL